MLHQLQKTNYWVLSGSVHFQSHVVGSSCQNLSGESREWQQVGSPACDSCSICCLTVYLTLTPIKLGGQVLSPWELKVLPCRALLIGQKKTTGSRQVSVEPNCNCTAGFNPTSQKQRGTQAVNPAALSGAKLSTALKS